MLGWIETPQPVHTLNLKCQWICRLWCIYIHILNFGCVWAWQRLLTRFMDDPPSRPYSGVKSITLNSTSKLPNPTWQLFELVFNWTITLKQAPGNFGLENSSLSTLLPTQPTNIMPPISQKTREPIALVVLISWSYVSSYKVGINPL